MSGVGKMPIAIPTGVTVTVTLENVVTVKDPKSELVKAIHKDINTTVEGTQVVVTRPNDAEEYRALHGLTRALLDNMVARISQGLSETLGLNGIGRGVQLQGKKLVMSLGHSYPVEVEVIDEVGFKLDGTTRVIVEGIDKERVRAVAVNVRSWRKPEPYRGRGIKYSDEVIRRKESKTGK